MVELEREYTFLMNALPGDLSDFPSKIIEDNYIPADVKQPITRIRRSGDKYVITKKYPEASIEKNHEHGDSSRMIEHTIELSRSEYDFLNQLPGKRLKKRRFNYNFNGCSAEIDVYLGDLSGLVVVDFEFDSDAAMAAFEKPDFVGVDVTQESLTAGGRLCGKKYSDIGAELLKKYDYEQVENVKKYDE